MRTLAEWYSKNGFDAEGNTYVYWPADSFNVKDNLKSAGFRFNASLLWHAATIPQGYEDKVIKVNSAEVAELYQWGGAYYEYARRKIEKKCKALRPAEDNTKGEFIGEVGKYINDIVVKITKMRIIDGIYGPSVMLVMEDKNNNRIVWFTTSPTVDDLTEGMEIIIQKATVKRHDDNDRFGKQTVISRAKILV